LWVYLDSIYEWICGIFSVQVCDVAVASTLTMSWLYDVCTMFVGKRDYTNIHYRLGISFIYFFKLLCLQNELFGAYHNFLFLPNLEFYTVYVFWRCSNKWERDGVRVGANFGDYEKS
jgi:hypothetical protein